ncbi:MAG: hypothetical protein U0903_14185 [Planctomycetales bacterium]
MNTCPVYRRSGGHVTPRRSPDRSARSSARPRIPPSTRLCRMRAACADPAPMSVRSRSISHTQLLTWRRDLVQLKLLPSVNGFGRWRSPARSFGVPSCLRSWGRDGARPAGNECHGG